MRQRAGTYLAGLLAPVERRNGWQLAEALELPDNTLGVYVSSVVPGGPSEKGGVEGGSRTATTANGMDVRRGGDIVTAIDDMPVVRFEDLVAFLVTKAEPGQTVAILGATGAGKSSLVNLIPRFYDPSAGRILIDGQDLCRVTQSSLRRQMGIVLQDPFLFNGTVAENIHFGRLEASDAEVEAAARAVGAHDFIVRLRNGYATSVEEGGLLLSVGQRQLISFARALLADPRILILDEATSSVDTRTEVQIQEALLKLMEGRTSFVIAHRLSTIRNADQVLVIDDGRIIERLSLIHISEPTRPY